MRILTSWDDGAYQDIRIADLLRKHNLPGIFYIPAQWQHYCKSKGWEPLTTEDLLGISNDFEIGSHGVTHALLTQVPLKTAVWEIQQSKIMLEEIVDKEVTSFCYPRGYSADHLKKEVAKVYLDARNTLVGSITPPTDPYWTATSVHTYNRTEYGNMNWFDYGVKLLDKAKRNPNSVFHLWGHSWEVDKYNGWNALDRLMGLMAQV